MFKNRTTKFINHLIPDMDHQDINPHAIRHLVATLFINDNPGNFVALSASLNDSLKVVIDTYAEIAYKKQSQFISNWSSNKSGVALPY